MKELGHRLSDAELDELKRSRYGDVRGRQANLAESPAQLLLEAASVKQSASKRVLPNIQQNHMPSKPSTDLESSAASQSLGKASETQAEDGKKNGETGGDGLTKAGPKRISSPVKQREYRRSDGRKRIIPEAVGVPVHQENISGLPQNASDFPPLAADQQKDDKVPLVDSRTKEVSLSHCSVKERLGATARTQVTESLVIEKVPASAGTDGRINVEHSGIVSLTGFQASFGSLTIRVFDKKEGVDGEPFCLEAKPVERAVNDMVGIGNTFMTKETEVTCTKGAQRLWSDRILAKVSVLAGNANFWAVGCEDGSLQVCL